MSWQQERDINGRLADIRVIAENGVNERGSEDSRTTIMISVREAAEKIVDQAQVMLEMLKKDKLPDQLNGVIHVQDADASFEIYRLSDKPFVGREEMLQRTERIWLLAKQLAAARSIFNPEAACTSDTYSNSRSVAPNIQNRLAEVPEEGMVTPEAYVATLRDCLESYLSFLKAHHYEHTCCPLQHDLHAHSLIQADVSGNHSIFCHVCGHPINPGTPVKACTTCSSWHVCQKCDGEKIDESYAESTFAKVQELLRDVFRTTSGQADLRGLDKGELADLERLVVHACICKNMAVQLFEEFVSSIASLAKTHERLPELAAVLEGLARDKAENGPPEHHTILLQYLARIREGEGPAQAWPQLGFRPSVAASTA